MQIKLEKSKLPLSLQVLSITNEGQITLSINGKVYEYWLDTAYLEDTERGLRQSPGKTLSFLKRKACCVKRKEELEVRGKR